MADQLTLSDLKVGMKVKKSQLSNILDTHIILINTEIVGDTDVEGKLVYCDTICREDEYEKWFHQTQPITTIYFNSEEWEDGIVYDE